MSTYKNHATGVTLSGLRALVSWSQRGTFLVLSHSVHVCPSLPNASVAGHSVSGWGFFQMFTCPSLRYECYKTLEPSPFTVFTVGIVSLLEGLGGRGGFVGL